MITRSLGRNLCRFASVDAAPEKYGDQKLKKIGKALETYLKRSRDHASMMNRERADFELGRRHLANMMSVDQHALTQQDIDKAIEYLFPSALTDPKARPVMRSPDEILPKFHRFSFDDEGRPHGSRFFTLSPNFYSLLSKVATKTQNITRFYNERAKIGRVEGTDMQPINLSGSQWLTEAKMRKKLGEKISSDMYIELLTAFDYLTSLPGSVVEEKFIGEYRETLASTTESKLFGPRVPEVEISRETNKRQASVRTHCKNTTVNVTVSDAGTGQFDVNGQRLYEFRSIQAREVLLAPMIVANVLGRVDVKATSTEGGQSSLPRAVRHGTALCVAALYPESEEPLRLAGLLTLDPRKKERSKVNQPGARAKWIWKRR